MLSEINITFSKQRIVQRAGRPFRSSEMNVSMQVLINIDYIGAFEIKTDLSLLHINLKGMETE